MITHFTSHGGNLKPFYFIIACSNNSAASSLSIRRAATAHEGSPTDHNHLLSIWNGQLLLHRQPFVCLKSPTKSRHSYGEIFVKRFRFECANVQNVLLPLKLLYRIREMPFNTNTIIHR